VSLVDRVREVLPPRYRELAKFLVVGGTAWVVDAGLFTLLSHTVLDKKVITSKIISILVSTIVSYVLNREWSFNTRGGREMHHEAMLFFLVNGLALGLNLVPLAISHYLIGINVGNGYSRLTVSIADWISANIIGTLVGMVFRYWAYRRFVFPDELSDVGQPDDGPGRRDTGDGQAAQVPGTR
jgi:putative flippase GtrA